MNTNTQYSSGSHPLEEFVRTRCLSLWHRLEGDGSAAKAELANLRRSVNSRLEDCPQVWGTLYEGFPPELLGRQDEPSRSERAAHRALALFALHQQSKPAVMHRTGTGLGHAVRELADPTATDQHDAAVLRRFSVLVTSDGAEEFHHYLRGVVQQLRAESVPLDYGLLARDLVGIESPETAGAVRLRWARQLHSNRKRPRPDDVDAGEETPSRTNASPDLD